MNYNRPLIIALIALLSLCSIVVSAAEPDAAYIESRITQRANNITDTSNADVTVYRKQGGGKVIVRNQNNNKNAEFAIKANAKTLAGRFARGANAAALAYAVVAILGEGIDWVLDPENNSIKYTSEDGYMWKSVTFDNGGQLYPTPQEAAEGNCRAFTGCLGVTELLKRNDEFYYVRIKTKSNYNQSAWHVSRVKVTGQQSISLDTIANHVINNEDNSTTNNITNNYYYAVNDTLSEQIDNGDYDPDIKSAFDQVNDKDPSPSDKPSDGTGTHTSPNSDTNSDTKPQEQPSDKPQDESKPFELPAFCDWAGKVCDFIDWVKHDDTDKDTEVDIQTDNIPTIDSSIRFSGQCPSNIVINGSFAGRNFEFFNFEWHKFCEILSYIKYIIVSMASYQAVRILGGVNVND